jgi:PucR C-terminal helix-turn-helix domain/GGDEF-like domain
MEEVELVGGEAYWQEFSAMAEQVLESAFKLARARPSQPGRAGELLRQADVRDSAGAVGIPDPAGWAAAVGALLGRWADPSELGYDLAFEHLAVVADSASALEGLAQRAGRQLLTVPLPGGGAWGWLGADERISDADLDALVVGQRRDEGMVAFGEPASGIAGFAESHWQAREAAAIARALGQHVVRFADVLLPIALRREPDLARSFVDRELRVLARPDERTQQLRATLCAYLEHGHSVSATAAALRCDRKTIQRRLHAAEQLLRRHVDDRSGELLVALRTIDLLLPADRTSPSADI